MIQATENGVRHLDQQAIAKHMAIGVVHFFEVIQIEIDQPYVAVTAFANRPVNIILNGVAVWQASDGIGIGQ